tara:strand:- start:2439 stop:2888 length:450 start_codon:yes stop_codon:yes gene_type:complete
MTHFTRTSALFIICLSISGVSAAHGLGPLPTFQCTLTNKLNVYYWPGFPEKDFSTNAPEVFLICDSNNAVTGDRIKAVWVADHVKNDSYPPNKTLAVKTRRYVKHQNSDETFEANLSLAKPEGGWPLGNYHVQLYVNNVEGQIYRFNVR